MLTTYEYEASPATPSAPLVDQRLDAAALVVRGGLVASLLVVAVILRWPLMQALSLGSALALVASVHLRPPMTWVTTSQHVRAAVHRLVRSWAQSEWTEEDRALMLARDVYLKTLCPRCGHPKETAWHPDNDGWFEVTQTFECHACTALAREGNDAAEPVEFHAVTDTRDYAKDPLPPMPTGPRMNPDELADAMGGAE